MDGKIAMGPMIKNVLTLEHINKGFDPMRSERASASWVTPEE